MFSSEISDACVVVKENAKDPHPLPPTASSEQLLQQALGQIESIATSPNFGNNTCSKCIAALEVGKFLAMAAPEQGPNLAVALCQYFNFSSTCQTFSLLELGSVITQVVANADVASLDGQVRMQMHVTSRISNSVRQLLCQNFLGLCPLPPTSPLNLTGWFAKPKPNPLPPPKQPSGKRLRVLHISDLHLDASMFDWCLFSLTS